jgi:2-polyprenyl-3-methyl-5-hydroxy-6-metoxy-1,4-benzoquinol methylase
MSATALTERQWREREYYEQYSALNAPQRVRFDPIEGVERRPWNPYWFLCESVRSCYRARSEKLLDFGCGPGVYSTLFAKLGFEVFGFDISPSNITLAEELADRYGLNDRAHFQTGVGEQLNYDDETFDVIVGVDILHHVDIARSIKECMRVLKKGGHAFFKEPVEVPAFDTLRNTAGAKWLVPKSASLERHITEDERKLTGDDLKLIRSLCSDVTVKRFRLLSRLDAFNKELATSGKSSSIEKLDEQIFRYLPFTRTFGGDIVIRLTK